eukprot:g2684.t1
MLADDWTSLRDVQYRKIHLYDLDWAGDEDRQLDRCLVAVAKYGGAVAMVRDETKLLKMSAKDSVTPTLRICNCAGGAISETQLDRAAQAPGTASERGRLLTMGWTDGEMLVMVRERGGVEVRDIMGELSKTLELVDESSRRSPEPDLVVACEVWGDGVVALLGSGKVKAVSGIHSPEPRHFSMAAGLGSSGAPLTAMAVLEPQFTASGALEVVLATEDGNVLAVDEHGVEDGLLEQPLLEPIVKMAVAPNGRFLACFARDGKLAVMSSNFATKVLNFDTSSSQPPEQMVWCGEDSVLLHFRGMGVLMVGPYGDWTRFSYPPEATVLLAPDSDCCKIFTDVECELLQRVPLASEAIFRMGSTDPAAMLFDAAAAFDEGDPRADELIRAMEREGDTDGEGHPLLEAVQSCIAAAAGEFDVPRQKALMGAAGYGKSFLSDYDSDEFVECCRKLRVLNNCRHKSCGMPLTSQQYDRLTPEVLVDRLAMRHMHFLAIRVCEHLRLRRDRMVVHWACKKIAKACADGAAGKPGAPTDAELTREVVKKLQPCGQISYADVARAAERAGRRRLATMLLDLEPLASDQVPLLLSMGENELGLKKAILSGEDDLVYLSVMHIEQEAGSSEKGREAFCELMLAHPEALRLLKVYYREKGGYMERRKLHNLCVFSKQYLEAGTLAVRKAYTQERLDGRLEGMKEAEGLFAHRKDLQFQQACTREQAELLELQRDLERKTGLDVFVDMSVSETLYHLIVVAASGGVQQGKHGLDGPQMMAEATALQKRLKVPDKRFWHIKIKALASVGDWEALRKFGSERKSPIGYKPFALACMRTKQTGLFGEDAERYITSYIDRIPQAEDRYDLYLENKSWEKAAEAAARLKDPRRIAEVRRLAVPVGPQAAPGGDGFSRPK